MKLNAEKETLFFGQALQRKFAENVFSKRSRLKGLPKLDNKNDKVKFIFT